MPTPLKLQGMVGLEESTYGTDATPADTDGIRGRGTLWTDLTNEFAFPNRQEDVWSNSLVKAPPAPPRGRFAALDLLVQLRGAGAAYKGTATIVRPPSDVLLRACGLSRTHVDTGGSESVTYALADTGHSSATLYCYAGGMLHRLIGVRGGVTINPRAGELGEARFNLMGMLATDPTDVSVPSITYPAVVPPAVVGIGLAIVPSGGSSWSPEVGDWEIMTNPDIQRLDDVNAADGIGGFYIAGFSPQVRLPVRKAALSDYPFVTLVDDATLHTIDATVGGTQYNRYDVDINAAYIENYPAPGDAQGFAQSEFMYELQDLALVFD